MRWSLAFSLPGPSEGLKGTRTKPNQEDMTPDAHKYPKKILTSLLTNDIYITNIVQKDKTRDLTKDIWFSWFAYYP